LGEQLSAVRAPQAVQLLVVASGKFYTDWYAPQLTRVLVEEAPRPLLAAVQRFAGELAAGQGAGPVSAAAAPLGVLLSLLWSMVSTPREGHDDRSPLSHAADMARYKILRNCRNTVCPALMAIARDGRAPAAAAPALAVLGMLADEEAAWPNCRRWPDHVMVEGGLRDEVTQCTPLLAAAATLLAAPERAEPGGAGGATLDALHALYVTAFFAGLAFNDDEAAARAHAVLAACPEAGASVVGLLLSPFADDNERCVLPAMDGVGPSVVVGSHAASSPPLAWPPPPRPRAGAWCCTC
jgi:hypothetical protein